MILVGQMDSPFVRRVAVTMLIEVARLMPGMIVMLFVVMIGHGRSP